MTRGLSKIFNTMFNREETTVYESADWRAIAPGRFQVLEVDENKPIKTFVVENGLIFNKGRGFYEFTKTETIQGKKEVILIDRATGDLFEGEAAREMLGLPNGTTVRIRPNNLEKYVVFVQSTSVNRKLIGETRFFV